LRRPRESVSRRPPILFGLRPRLLGALVLTAAVTLAVAALALFAPLESQLRKNTINLTEAQVGAIKAALGAIALVSPLDPYRQRVDARADTLRYKDELGSLIVWRHSGGATTQYDRTDPRTDAHVKPTLAAEAFTAAGQPVQQEVDGVLAVAERYRAQPPDTTHVGIRYVVEVFRQVNYLGTANSVVRSAFLLAALVGLAVAILLGVALSSRLLRRLRLLQDATRSLDEDALDTLVVPHERVSDEIGELASAFATMQARLRQQEDARRAFVANASHELRTPLASLDGMLELLADDLAREPIDLADARERVSSAQLQSRRLRGLASDLLDLSRLDAALELRSEPVELGETARAVAAEFDARARDRGVALALDEVGGQSWAQADPGSVARIVRILLDNALRVAPQNSMIEIRIGDRAGEPAIEVADHGPGVPQDERELIFKRFQRGSQRSDEAGFGLGLAIGSELAARMGGSLDLTDNGSGATFRLKLPEVRH
jgi:signal transduction histidine kinase